VGDVENFESEASSEVAPHRLAGGAALKLHVTLLMGLTLCGAAFWFELGRAERGNSLSWAYVFEWPLLAAYAVYMWWKFLHPAGNAPRGRRAVTPAVAPEFEGMLLAWQEHQRELEADQAASAPDVGRSGETETTSLDQAGSSE
jgi:hypothetical protein